MRVSRRLVFVQAEQARIPRLVMARNDRTVAHVAPGVKAFTLSDCGDIGCRYTPRMLRMVKLAFEPRKKGVINF